MPAPNRQSIPELASGDAPNPTAPSQEKRSRHGCTTCKNRHLKCDETHPICSHCSQKGLTCVWPQPIEKRKSRSSTYSGAPGERKRVISACVPCRLRKVRCDGIDRYSTSTDNPTTCPRCRRLDLPCSWVTSTSSSASRTRDSRSVSPRPRVSESGADFDSSMHTTHAVPTHASAGESFVEAFPGELDAEPGATATNPKMKRNPLKKDDITKWVRIYFATVHQYGFLAFIHQPSYFRLLENHQAPEGLTSLMIACAMRFAGETSESTDQADRLYEEAFKELIHRVYTGYDALDLMEVLLARTYAQARGRFTASAMLLGNAVKMVQKFLLHTFDETYPDPQSVRHNPLLKPEALRRMAWACFYLDTLADGGVHGLHTLTENGFRIQLPCDEAAFLRGQNVTTTPLTILNLTSPSSDLFRASGADASISLGISAHIIKAAAMRRRILHFNSLLRYSSDASMQLLAAHRDLEISLRTVITELPADLTYSDDSLFVHSSSLTSFILLHTLRHNCFLMLAWAKLNITARDPAALGYLQPPCVRDRLEHAFSVSGIIKSALRLGVNCDPFVGVQAYSALEVLLFDPLRLGKSSEFEVDGVTVTQALVPLLELIRKLAPADVIVGHLRGEACIRLKRLGFEQLLDVSEREACQLQHFPTAGVDEFDFPSVRWHRIEKHRPPQQVSPVNSVDRTPASTEALRDLYEGTGEGPDSYSPPPHRYDAGNNIRHTADQSLPAHLFNSGWSPVEGLSNVSGVKADAQPGDPSLPGTTDWFPFIETSASTSNQRWSALGASTTAEGDLASLIDPFAIRLTPDVQNDGTETISVDDFARFLEQSGYINTEGWSQPH